MGTLTNYRKLTKQVLDEHADFLNRLSPGEWEAHTIFDDEHNRYMLFRTGWRGKERIHKAILYVRLQNGKIWIEEDWTEDGITPQFLAAGVPKEDIVLAFHHPEIRPFTEFAVA